MTKLKSPFTKRDYEFMAEIFKVLSNPKRLEILALISHKEMAVSEITKVLGVHKANTSQHLMILRYLNLVTAKRQGKNIFYKLVEPKIIEPLRIFNKLRHDKKN